MTSSPLTVVDLDSSWKTLCWSVQQTVNSRWFLVTFRDSQSRIETSSEATVGNRKKENIPRVAKASEPVRSFPQRAVGAAVDGTSKHKDEAETYRVM